LVLYATTTGLSSELHFNDAFETWDVRRLKEIIHHCERTFASKGEVIGPW